MRPVLEDIMAFYGSYDVEDVTMMLPQNYKNGSTFYKFYWTYENLIIVQEWNLGELCPGPE